MTPTINTENPQSLAIDLLAGMVASSADFAEKAAVGDAIPTPEEVLASFVHYPYYRLPNQQVDKPFAVIYEAAGGFKYERRPDGAMVPRGVLNMMLGINVNDAEATEGELEEVIFNNWQGNVVAHLVTRSQIPGELRCLLEQTVPPTRSHPAHVAGLLAQMPFWFVEYTVTWGAYD